MITLSLTSILISIVMGSGVEATSAPSSSLSPDCISYLTIGGDEVAHLQSIRSRWYPRISHTARTRNRQRIESFSFNFNMASDQLHTRDETAGTLSSLSFEAAQATLLIQERMKNFAYLKMRIEDLMKHTQIEMLRNQDTRLTELAEQGELDHDSMIRAMILDFRVAGVQGEIKEATTDLYNLQQWAKFIEDGIPFFDRLFHGAQHGEETHLFQYWLILPTLIEIYGVGKIHLFFEEIARKIVSGTVDLWKLLFDAVRDDEVTMLDPFQLSEHLSGMGIPIR